MTVTPVTVCASCVVTVTVSVRQMSSTEPHEVGTPFASTVATTGTWPTDVPLKPISFVVESTSPVISRPSPTLAPPLVESLIVGRV